MDIANAELREHEERNAALRAVQHALTAEETAQFMDEAARTWPMFRQEGYTVADVLDHTLNYDEFLEHTEPFYHRFASQLPQDVRTGAAVHAFIILGRVLAPARVISLLQRAGMTAPPRFPEVEVGLLAREGFKADANHLLLRVRAEQGMRAAGVPESLITEFRASLRETGECGYSPNVADIARWVTFTDRYTALPRKIYDPVPDLATVLASAAAGNLLADSDPSGQVGAALASLRAHLDMLTPETIAACLYPFFGRMP
jgi:hypothetical protein